MGCANKEGLHSSRAQHHVLRNFECYTPGSYNRVVAVLRIGIKETPLASRQRVEGENRGLCL